MSAAAATARPEPTQEQLRATWERIRRDSWPATFEEAMADRLLAALLRLATLHPAPRSPSPPPTRTRVTSAPSMVLRTTTRTPPPPQIDRKRAAAGDRDDD